MIVLNRKKKCSRVATLSSTQFIVSPSVCYWPSWVMLFVKRYITVGLQNSYDPFNIVWQSHLQANSTWLHRQVREKARQSGVSTKTWAEPSVETEVGLSSSPVDWGLSLVAEGVLGGSSDWQRASQDSQSLHIAAKVFWCVSQLWQNPGPLWRLPSSRPQLRLVNCRE